LQQIVGHGRVMLLERREPHSVAGVITLQVRYVSVNPLQ
jgi:hypothetical protein